MYRISELAQRVGLSRSTLLYYEKLGLICGQRQANGYRVYSDRDLQRLKLLQQLQAGGLTLKECQACLESRIEQSLLLQRLEILDQEIAEKQRARDLVAAMTGQSSLKDWHQALDAEAPDAHLDWLMAQGFSEKQALHLKWLSKDMNEHDAYMAEFMAIYAGIERLGPGSEQDTARALAVLPENLGTILEIGCGTGVGTLQLAQSAHVTAIDNHEPFLAELEQRASEHSLMDKISCVCASMTDLPFDPSSFDVIWAEGSAYIMGFEKALQNWKPFIKPGGYLVVSDAVWLCDERDPEGEAFWQQEYPDISSVQARLSQIEAQGYQLLTDFTLSEQAWENYYGPLERKLNQLDLGSFKTSAGQDVAKEIQIHRQHSKGVGYQVFVLRR